MQIAVCKILLKYIYTKCIIYRKTSFKKVIYINNKTLNGIK